MYDINYDYINTPPFTSSNIEALNGLPTNKTIHYTFLFNTFMMMTIFNQFNCRKLGLKEFNIFDRFLNNPFFLIIVAGEFVAQWAIV